MSEFSTLPVRKLKPNEVYSIQVAQVIKTEIRPSLVGLEVQAHPKVLAVLSR